ncbi:MAG: primosomal replication protein [Idiomarinaceae bacterium]|uniref:primosomal replication protein PriC n=1 Tax=Idiomarina sp. 28-8 TaxID=1260624 RepID=UPI000303D419|nr:primosomal replication protein PriC [Idiomarina sp. 28-8]NWO03997.1 primosomal replication protein [Idiomarinaceae bacterium]
MREILNVTSIQHIEQLLNTLQERAEEIDGKNRKKHRQLSENWFSSSLFSQSSNLAIDYVAETRNLFRQLRQSDNQQAQRYLAEKLSLQLEALNTAFRANRPPKQQQDHRITAQNQLQQMHQQLVTYRDYERRLTENLDTAAAGNNPTVIQSAQQRLNRCQMAIDTLEKKISRYEEG